MSAYLSDRIGRRANIALFAGCCALTVAAYLFLPLTDLQMLALEFPTGLLCGTAFPRTLGALFAELYPAEVRGAGVGLCYNFGRFVSAAFPVLVGYMSDSMPLGAAIGIAAVGAYTLVVAAVLALPETRGLRMDGKARPQSIRINPQAADRFLCRPPRSVDTEILHQARERE